MKHPRTIWRFMIWITTLGVSLITPILLCVFGAAWLRDRFSLPGWIIIPAIFLGLGGAVVNLLKFFRVMQHESDQNRQEDSHGRF